MDNYNYYYCGEPITRSEFLKHVPTKWYLDVDEFGYYSWGYYSAQKLELN